MHDYLCPMSYPDPKQSTLIDLYRFIVLGFHLHFIDATIVGLFLDEIYEGWKISLT